MLPCGPLLAGRALLALKSRAVHASSAAFSLSIARTKKENRIPPGLN